MLRTALISVTLATLPLTYSLVIPRQESSSSSPSVQFVNCSDAIPLPVLQSGIQLPSQLPSSLQCGFLQVPLDYSKPFGSGNNITVGFAIDRAANNSLGVLNYNPGGPALEVASYAWARALGAPQAAIFEGLENYDLLAIDVRGTYQSTSLNCSGVPADIPAAIPDTEEAYSVITNVSAQIAQQCVDGPAPAQLINFVGSADVAQDWNAVRKALSYDVLNIWAYSYGTFASAIYANKFPNYLGKLALDGVYAPGETNYDATARQTVALSRVIERADAYCVFNTSCPFHEGGKGAVIQAWEQVIALANNGTGGNVTVADVRAVAYNAYFNVYPQYDYFFLAMGGALQGVWDGFSYDLISPVLDFYVPSILPIICKDIAVADPSWSGFHNLSNAVLSPNLDLYDVHYTQTLYLLALCGGWPEQARSNVAYRSASSNNTILLNSDYDLNTPIEGALQAWSSHANADFIVRHGDGHGTLVAVGSPARDAGIAFMNGQSLSATSNEYYSVLAPPPTENYTVPDPYSVPFPS